MRWLDSQSFERPARRLAFQEMLNSVRSSAERISRLEGSMTENVSPAWGMEPVVAAFQAIRSVRLLDGEMTL